MATLLKAAFATGTAHVLTTSWALVATGTTVPRVVFKAANGRRVLLAQAKIQMANAEYGAGTTVRLKLRRVNNGAKDVANSATTYDVGIYSSGQDLTEAILTLPPVSYRLSGKANDRVELWAKVDALPDNSAGGGQVQIDEASLVALS